MAREKPSYLRRLPPTGFQGRAYVHRNMTFQDRATGWMDAAFHAEFRELQIHTLHRYRLICPAYCLMPDHMHVLWIGLRLESDQRNAMQFLRKHLNRVLSKKTVSLQSQPYDNVLRERDRRRHAFAKTVHYIVENPMRADLANSAKNWSYSGSLAVGYPSFDWREETFPDLLWRIVEEEAAKDASG